MTYAADTSVSVDKSRAEIEGTLRRYGADTFFSGWNADQAFVSFRVRDRFVKLSLPLPSKNEKRFHQDARYSHRTVTAAKASERYEQELRTRFRALLLVIKAKLESIEAKIETFEQAFLAHIVLPDQSLVGDRVQALIDEAYRTGSMANLLPEHGGR